MSLYCMIWNDTVTVPYSFTVQIRCLLCNVVCQRRQNAQGPFSLVGTHVFMMNVVCCEGEVPSSYFRILSDRKRMDGSERISMLLRCLQMLYTYVRYHRTGTCPCRGDDYTTLYYTVLHRNV